MNAPCCPLMCCIVQNTLCTCCLIHDARAARYPIWCMCSSLPVHLLLGTWYTYCTLFMHVLLGTRYTLPVQFLLVLLYTNCTYSCTCCLIPDARTVHATWYLMYGLHGLLNTWCTDCMNCSIPDARAARYPCTFSLIPNAQTAYYPPMDVLLNTWCTDCILPTHGRAA